MIMLILGCHVQLYQHYVIDMGSDWLVSQYQTAQGHQLNRFHNSHHVIEAKGFFRQP